MDHINSWLERRITLHSHDSPKEERANSLTHAFGALLSLAALIHMLKGAETAAARWAAGIFGLSMVLLYASSAVYHRVGPSNLKRFLRIMDHVNIYILIAGTYTPFCMTLPREKEIELLLVIWGIVVLGTVFKLVFWGRLKPLHTLIYLAMGWLVVFFIQDLKQVLPLQVLYWMLGGGLAYSLGTIFYASKKLPYYHAIWHLFVLAGSILFYIGISGHVLPLI